MVTTEALKSQKSDEKMEKLLSNISSGSMYSIAREELMTERMADMIDEVR